MVDYTIVVPTAEFGGHEVSFLSKKYYLYRGYEVTSDANEICPNFSDCYQI